MSVTIYTEPKVTLIAAPTFVEAPHLAVEWKGEATDGERLAEYAGRICYLSHHNPAKRTTAEYLENIKRQMHGSVLEHANYSVLIEQVSRSFTHELVRHRAGWGFSQVSQRYVDESDTAFVMPPALLRLPAGVGTVARDDWTAQMTAARDVYTQLSNLLFASYQEIEDRVHRRKLAREAARSVLPNATETKIVATANARAWRTMLELRTGEGAEAEMRRCAVEILKLLSATAPAFFSDFEMYVSSDGLPAARTALHKV